MRYLLINAINDMLLLMCCTIDQDSIENFAQSTISKASLNEPASMSALKTNDNIVCISEALRVEDLSDQNVYDHKLESKNESATSEGNAKKRKRKKDNDDEAVLQPKLHTFIC